MVPEFLWIYQLVNEYGDHCGIQLATELAVSAAESSPRGMYCAISAFRTLEGTAGADIVARLSTVTANLLERALAPAARLIPSHPFNQLFPKREYEVIAKAEETQRLSNALEAVSDPEGVAATTMLATAVYIAFRTKKLRVMEGSQLLELDELDHYPKTTSSRQVASAVRAQARILLHPYYDQDWPRAFWAECFELGECAV